MITINSTPDNLCHTGATCFHFREIHCRITDYIFLCGKRNSNNKKVLYMEIVSIERKTFEAMVAKFDRFVHRMEAICQRHGEKSKAKPLS